MKKFITYFFLYLLGIIIQFALAKHAAIFGLFPNVLLLALLYVGLARGSLAGQILGFAWGISWDVFSVGLFGSHALLFTVIGYLSGKFARKLDESKVATQVTLGACASIFFWLGIALIENIFGETSSPLRFDYIALLQIPYNTLLSPLVFGIAKYLSYFFGSGVRSFRNG